MGYALESMRKIRTMREERAGTELTGARRARAAAERERDEKAEARAQFEATKDVRRDRIYAAVMGRRVTRDDLDRAREAVTRIDEEGMLLEEAERAAQATLETRDREADAAKVRYVAAARNKAKIEQHRHVWEEEDRRLQELRADMEVEEFTGRRLTSDAAASLPPVGPRACASEPLRSLHAVALPFVQLLADNAILQSVLESIVAAPLSLPPSPERSVEASAPPTVIESPAPPALVGGDVLGAPRPGVEVPPAESSSVVSPVVSTRPDVAVVDESSVVAFAARRGRRALPSEGAVPGAVPSAPSAPSASSAPSAPSALPVSFVVPEVSAPAAAPTAAPVTAVEAVVAAFTPSAARAVEPVQVLVEAARAVADTLLVTPGLLRGEGEIRIQLRPDVLDGTEIHIVVAGRQLTVAFAPPAPDLVALIEQSRPQLTAHLAERIHSFQIAVDVRRRVRSEERA